MNAVASLAAAVAAAALLLLFTTPADAGHTVHLVDMLVAAVAVVTVGLHVNGVRRRRRRARNGVRPGR